MAYEDLISRQAAIDALGNGALVNYQATGHFNGLVKAIDVIKGLASAQPEPEIIRCKDCKHGKYDIFDRGMWCELHTSLDVTEDDFCSFAERKSDVRH